MPSLDDIPTLPTATLSADDQFAVIDGADRRSPRRATLAALKTFTLSGNLGAIQATTVSATTVSATTVSATGAVSAPGATISGELVFGSLRFDGSFATSDPMIQGAIWADPDDGYTLKVSLGF
jgi:hypothetical protein